MSSATPDALPLVSVIVPHYRDLDGLRVCLAALDLQTYPRARFEVVVADNNSPEGEAAVAAVVAGRAKLAVVTEQGAGPARNGGVAASTGRLLAFTDSDCIPEPQWLAEGLAALENVDIVGGAMQVLVADEADMTPAEAFERVFAFDNRHYVIRKGFTVTANLFCARAVFEAVGGFRVGVPEDLDWCHRARAAGYRIGYAPDARVGHPARRTWTEIVRKWSRLNEEAFGLARTERMGRVKWLVKALAMPLSAIAQTARPFSTPKLTAGRDRLSALRMLYLMRFWRAADSLRLLARRP
ncbi:glycosyltransferase [Phenylobacterium sp.]|uniref:glycosyltransferase family 2 protein n=1 Tax=Phenylobacterium sp. TaxID=1871053 RepID=UPI0025E98D69|nr:glycosyltransferase [Phenylobacterium sp.]